MGALPDTLLLAFYGQGCKWMAPITFSSSRFNFYLTRLGVLVLMARWGVLLPTCQLTGEMFCLWECKQSGASLVSPRLVRAHWVFKAVSLVRPRLPFLSTPNSTLLSHHLHLITSHPHPSHSPAKVRGKKNQWILYLSPARGHNSTWITVHKRRVTD